MDIRGFVERTSVLGPLATLVLANSLLLAPLWLLSGGVGGHLFALEVGVVVGGLMLLPGRAWSRSLARGLAVALVVFALLGLADATSHLSLARPLNLYLDVRLVSAVANLLAGTLGVASAVAVMVGAVVSAVGVTVVLTRSLAGLPVDAPTGARRVMGWVLLCASLLAVPVRWVHPAGVALGLPAVRLLNEQSAQLVRMVEERERFEAEMMESPATYAMPGLLEGLGGRDVIMAFIESYGMSALDDPRYAHTVRPRLGAMGEAVAAAGLHLATGALVAPSQGGMSWLGHGSVLSGLWLENQLRYDLLLAGDRGTLIDDFEAAGYRTVALMPAITLAWPEGERLGYERIYARKDIDYAGPSLNWVTMPDQFTWSFLERTIRGGSDIRPLFAEVALISSHAPWTPILPVLEWDAIGDGAVFGPWGEGGERPDELWRDTERVREHYALAIAYAIDAFASYATHFVNDRTVLIVLGDHQPAPLITGDAEGRGVPVHVIVAEPDLLEPFLAWGFREGAFPDPSGDPPRMDAFRSWFVTAFSTTPSVAER